MWKRKKREKMRKGKKGWLIKKLDDEKWSFLVSEIVEYLFGILRYFLILMRIKLNYVYVFY